MKDYPEELLCRLRLIQKYMESTEALLSQLKQDEWELKQELERVSHDRWLAAMEKDARADYLSEKILRS